LAKGGFDTSAAPRQIFFNDRNGMLMIRGTLAELQLAETIVAELNGSATQPQITIEVKIIELPESAVQQLGADHPSDATAELLAIAGIDWRTNASGTFSHVLTTPQARVLFLALQQQVGSKMLTAPKVATLSGRQAQIKTVVVRSILYGFEAVTNKPPQARVTTRPLSKLFELGPVVDVIPLLQPDHRMLTLTVTVGIREFLGYDNAEGSAPILPLPRFRQHQVSASGSVEDGQTLVLAGGTIADENVEATGRIVPAPASRVGEQPSGATNELVRRSRLICLTPRLVDPAGNPIHP
jgi:type II secretory pathway component GspD/PulD (secretin)